MEQNQYLKQNIFKKHNQIFSSIKNELTTLNGSLSTTLKTAQVNFFLKN